MWETIMNLNWTNIFFRNIGFSKFCKRFCKRTGRNPYRKRHNNTSKRTKRNQRTSQKYKKDTLEYR